MDLLLASPSFFDALSMGALWVHGNQLCVSSPVASSGCEGFLFVNLCISCNSHEDEEEHLYLPIDSLNDEIEPRRGRLIPVS